MSDAIMIQEALEDATYTRWRGMRTEKRNVGQARITVAALLAKLDLPDVAVDQVSKVTLKRLAREWSDAGLSAATITCRLNCLSALGVDVKGCRPKKVRKLQWWLDAESEDKVVAFLLTRVVSGERAAWAAHFGYSHCAERPLHLANLIRWTTRTGLRIEESLRLTRSDIKRSLTKDGVERVSVTVPGLKTSMSQATLVLAPEAVAVLNSLPEGNVLFDVPYHVAAKLWQQARKVLDLPDPSVATMKAMRRSAARNLHSVKGMPLDMVRTYLRHESVNTTMGYLRLTGGYNEEEMAKWL